MKTLRFLIDKTVYILIYFVVFLLAFLFIFKGYDAENTTQRDAIYLAVGTSLLAAGIVAILELWRELSRSKMLEKIRNVIFDAGIELAFPKRDLDKYDVLMKGLNTRLDITGYSLNAFYESYADLILENIREIPSITIRMLVVNPESEFSKHRAELEGKNYESVKTSINRLKKKFGSIKNIELRQIDSPLSTMIFRIDNVMFIGPHFYKKPSKSTLTFELNKIGWLFEAYEKEFDKLWLDANEF